MDFEPVQIETFAPLMRRVNEFASEYGLAISEELDKDPINPYASVFLLWPSYKCRGCFINICAKDPFAVGIEFRIAVRGSRGRHRIWNYRFSGDADNLNEILNEAAYFVQSEDGTNEK
jgi:hypothetical protein